MKKVPVKPVPPKGGKKVDPSSTKPFMVRPQNPKKKK